MVERYFDNKTRRVMIKNKKALQISITLLCIWFTLAMTGFKLAGHILVTPAWKDDFIFFIIYMAAIMSFLLYEKIGKFILSSWLFMWLASQFYFHWWVTIVGPWATKIEYFSGTIKLIPTTKIYIPDVYHVVLHLLILLAFVNAIKYIRQTYNS